MDFSFHECSKISCASNFRDSVDIVDSLVGGRGCVTRFDVSSTESLGRENCVVSQISPFSAAKIPACHICFLHLLRFQDLVGHIVHTANDLATLNFVPLGFTCNWCEFRLCLGCHLPENARLHQFICPRGEVRRKKLWEHITNLGNRNTESIPMAIQFCCKLVFQAAELHLSPDDAFQTLYNSEGYFDSHQSVPYSDNGFKTMQNLFHPIPTITEALFNQLISTFDQTNLYIEVESFSMMEDLEHPIPYLQALNRQYEDGFFSAIGPINSDDFPIPVVVGSAHYPTVARLNHSCDPNIDWRSVNGTNEIEIYALREISQHEELFISYIDQSLETSERQSLLQSLYGFTCRCSRCE